MMYRCKQTLASKTAKFAKKKKKKKLGVPYLIKVEL